MTCSFCNMRIITVSELRGRSYFGQTFATNKHNCPMLASKPVADTDLEFGRRQRKMSVECLHIFLRFFSPVLVT